MKSLLMTIFTFVSLGVFANDKIPNENNKVSDETILKVSTAIKENSSVVTNPKNCSMGFGSVRCSDGSTHNFYTSVYHDAYDTLDAVCNNAYNKCYGAAVEMSYTIDSVHCGGVID